MGKEFFKKTTDLLQAKQKKKQWQKIVISLSLVVAMITSGLLIHPAITMERKAICGQEEHTHSADCYEKKLNCNKEEHTASEVEAAKANGENIEEHKHSDSCYKEELTCDKKEHKHSEDCYPKETEAKEETTKAASTEEAKATAADNTEAKTTEAPKAEESTEASNGEKKADEAKDETTEEKQEEKAEARTLTAKGDDYTVQVDCPAEAKIPEGAELKVREIVKENKADKEEYEAYYKKAQEALKEKEGKETDISSVRFFDITFMVDGKEIEPAAKVEVKITYDKKVEVSDQGEVKSVHFGEEKTEVLDVKTNEENGKMDEVTFDATSFSVYGIVGTETISAPFTASDGNTYEVTVNYGKEAGIPANAKLKVSEVGENSSRYDGYVEQAAEAIDARTIDLQYVKLLDISIVDVNGDKVELNAPVDVQIKLLDKEQAEETTQVVHFEGTNETPVVMESSVEGDVVNFSTEGFSIYAVVDEGNTGDYARMNLHFMNGSEEVATVIVKNSDTLEELEDIIYDPGAGSMHEGEIFKGWYTSNTYTIDNADDAMDIAEVRQWAEAREIKENQDVYLYAMIFKNYVVNYLDENGVGLGSENVMMAANATNPNTDYTVQMVYEPKDDEHDFQGWYASEGETNIVSSDPTPTQDESGKNLYQNGTDLVIKGNVTFSVNAPEGHWLVFDENGKGATYNAPQFVKSGETPDEPNAQNMKRFGYSFEGWYKDEACTDGNEFDFSQPLEDKTTIYAKWTAAETANYTVIIWKQNVNGTGYDFDQTISLSGTVGQNVNTVSQQGTGNAAYASINGTNYTGHMSDEHDFTGFHLKEFTQNVKIVPEGNAVVNVYYDRTEYTLTFKTENNSGTTVEYKTTSGYELAKISQGSGMWTSRRYAIKINDKWYEITEYDRYVWDANEITDVPSSGKGYITYRYGRRYYRNAYVNGTEYTIPSDSSVIKTITALYQQDISSNFPIIGSNGTDYSGYVWNPQDSAIFTTGQVPSLEIMPAESTTFIAMRYGTSNTAHFYYYLETLNGVAGDVSYGGKQYDRHKDVEISIADSVSSTKSEDFYDIDGFTQDTSNPAYGSNGTVKLTGWNNYSISFYYDRLSYRINYMDGVYVDGNNNPIQETKSPSWGTSSLIPYQSDISSYNKDGTDYFTPTKAGYAFEGWYLDDGCTQPCTFTTMPKGGITVYAKWRQIQYRVFLHPNADGDQSLDWGSASQDMNFRISLDGIISVPTGRRTEWEFVGWYTDPSLSASSHFNMDTKLNEDTVKTPYDKTVDMTDPMDKFGNGATYNSDITGWDDDNNPSTPGKDRFWITKKLDLYAKWRAKIVGAKGIGVQFDAGQGKITVDGREYQTYSDGNLYLDQAQAPTLAASTPNDPANWEFQYWVLQKWVADEDLSDGGYYEDTNIHLNPGDSFEVLKSYAHQVISEYEDDGVTPKVATYTVQVRAQYKMKSQEGTPAHIYFYGNNHDKDGNPIQGITIGEAGNEPKDEETYSNININQAYDILSIESVIGDSKLYEGYKFLGWAKNRTDTTPWATLNEDGETYTVIQHDNTTDTDLTLTQVTKIAADEKQPYENLYAVWEIQKYKVSIKKEVIHGSESDLVTPFTINYEYDKDQLQDGSVNLKNADEQIVTRDVPYGTIVSVTETGYPAFEKTYTAKLTTDDQGVEIEPRDAETSGNGFKVTGDIVVTVTNTRKTQDFSFTKTLEASQIEGDSSLVADAIFVLIDPTDESVKYTGETSVDGVVSFNGVTFGTYTLRESSAPEGYATITDHTIVVDENGASIQLNGEDIGDEGVYTINDPKAETGAIILKKTDYSGTQIDGATFTISAFDGSRYSNLRTISNVGEVPVEGLKVGTKYELQETVAPDGYVVVGDPWYFQIKLDGTVEVTSNDDKISISGNKEDGYVISIKNEAGQALPNTGGSGTLPYTLGGIALLMASALMYGFRMRRRERRLN